jgi:hypothetical protein
MPNLTSSLAVRLIDDVSKPARTVAQALRDAEKAARDVAKGMAGAGATDRFVKSLSGLKAHAQGCRAGRGCMAGLFQKRGACS